MTRKIMSSLLVIALAAMLIGLGTFAYFSDTETSSANTFTAGTLNLQLSNDSTNWTNGVTSTWHSPSNWAPGDPEYSSVLYMKNVGTTGALVARIKGLSLSETGSNISDHIYITTINYTEDGAWIGGATTPVNLVSYYTTVFGDRVAPLTLREFATSPYSMVFWTGTGNPGASGIDYLPAGGTLEALRLGFTFEPGAGNQYQGTSATFDLRVTADDDPSILGSGGGGSHGYAE